MTHRKKHHSACLPVVYIQLWQISAPMQPKLIWSVWGVRAPRSPQNPDHRLPSTGQRANRRNQQIVSISSQSVRTCGAVRHMGRAHPILPLFIPQYSPSSYRGHTGTDVTWERVTATTRSAYPAKRPGHIHCRRVHRPNDRHPAYNARPRKATPQNISRGWNKGARSFEAGGTFPSRRLGLAPPWTTTTRAPQQVPPPVGRPIRYHTVRSLTHVHCKPTHFFFHSFIATMSYSLQTSFSSVMKDWADKYHVWGTPTRSPSRSNSR